MRILFIGKRFYTNRDAYGERFGRIYQIPYCWASQGHEVDLWLVDYHRREGQARNDDRLAIETTPVLRRRFFARLLTSCIGLRRRGRPDLVVSSGDCYVGLLGYVIARICRARFIFDVYDRYDVFDGYRRLPGFDPQSFLLRHSDAATFASVKVLEDLRHLARKALLVRNGIDSDTFKPLPMKEARRTLNLPVDACLVGYFGSMEPERGVEDLIEATAALRKSGVDIELVIGGKAGTGIDFDRPWLHFLGNLSYEQMPAALASCDLLSLPYRQSEFLDNASSCKIAEYIAMRRPIVATRTPNLARNFPDQARQLDGLLAAPQDVDDFARCLSGQLTARRLVDMPQGMSWREISRQLLLSIEMRNPKQQR